MSNLILALEKAASTRHLEQLPNALIELHQGLNLEECLFGAPRLIADYRGWDVFFDGALQVQRSAEQFSCKFEPRISLYTPRARMAF